MYFAGIYVCVLTDSKQQDIMQIISVCFLTGLEKALKGNGYYRKLKTAGNLFTSLISLQISLQIVLYRDVLPRYSSKLRQ